MRWASRTAPAPSPDPRGTRTRARWGGGPLVHPVNRQWFAGDATSGYFYQAANQFGGTIRPGGTAMSKIVCTVWLLGALLVGGGGHASAASSKGKGKGKGTAAAPAKAVNACGCYSDTAGGC